MRARFVFLVLLSSFTCTSIREDDLKCEEAVAHLAECCPGFKAQTIDCDYTPGCYDTYAQFDVPLSDCIVAFKCEEIRMNGLCEIRTATASTTPFDDRS